MMTRPVLRRRGLTLMELVVVMAVLAALAAILVPLFPNLLRRAHKTTDATQTAEVTKAVQLYQGVYTSYPNEWDLMTTSTGTTAPSFLPADGGNVFGGAAVIGNLTPDEVSALSRVGITLGHHFVASNPNHPTMDPYAAAATAPTTLSTTTPVYIIEQATTSGEIPTELKNILAKDASATPPPRFVVFGVGPRNTMVSRVMQNAPTSVPQNADFTPANRYARVGVVFQISGTGINDSGSTSKRARFMGSVALEDDELESTEKDIIGYHDLANSGQ